MHFLHFAEGRISLLYSILKNKKIRAQENQLPQQEFHGNGAKLQCFFYYFALYILLFYLWEAKCDTFGTEMYPPQFMKILFTSCHPF